jgi:hypothetical protein
MSLPPLSFSFQRNHQSRAVGGAPIDARRLGGRDQRIRSCRHRRHGQINLGACGGARRAFGVGVWGVGCGIGSRDVRPIQNIYSISVHTDVSRRGRGGSTHVVRWAYAAACCLLLCCLLLTAACFCVLRAAACFCVLRAACCCPAAYRGAKGCDVLASHLDWDSDSSHAGRNTPSVPSNL